MFLVPAVVVLYACDPCCGCQTPLSVPAVSPPLLGVGPGVVACGDCGDRVACVYRTLCDYLHAPIIVDTQPRVPGAMGQILGEDEAQ
jgi:hypothetical protein